MDAVTNGFSKATRSQISLTFTMPRRAATRIVSPNTTANENENPIHPLPRISEDSIQSIRDPAVKDVSTLSTSHCPRFPLTHLWLPACPDCSARQ
jgi:hypothetical protein